MKKNYKKITMIDFYKKYVLRWRISASTCNPYVSRTWHERIMARHVKL